MSVAPISIHQGQRAHQNLEYSILIDVVPRRGRQEIGQTVSTIITHCGIFPTHRERDVLSVIIANLFAAWATRGNPFLAVPHRPEDYKPGSRLRALWLRYHPTVKIVRCLQASGLIEKHQGVYFDKIKRVTRIRATDKLVALFVRHRLDLGCIEALDREVVELRGPKVDGQEGKPLNISRGILAAQARPIKDKVRRINDFIGKASVELHLSEQDFIDHFVKRPDGRKELHAPHPLHNHLCRVFNESFAYGGRFYRHWAQEIPRNLRRFIRINTLPVMELDYKAIHPRLLYAELGLCPDGDLYVPEGWPEAFRDVFKLLLLAAINANSLTEAVKGAREKLCQDWDWAASNPECLRDGWLYPAFEALANKHQAISGHFFTGAGLRLMRKDSDIAERVMLNLMDKGIITIPIHDSFLVAYPFTEELSQAMLEASEVIAGMPIAVDEKWPIQGQLALLEQLDTEGSVPVMDGGPAQEGPEPSFPVLPVLASSRLDSSLGEALA